MTVVLICTIYVPGNQVGACGGTESMTTDETMSELTGWLNSGDFNKIKWASVDT